MMSQTGLGRRSGKFLLWPVLILASFSSAMAGEDGGPIAIRNQFAPGLFFLYPTPEGARVLDPGRFEIGTNASYSSVFNKEMEGTAMLLMDFEVLRWTVRGRWGVHDRFDVDLEIPFLYFTGGFLDGAIKSFHDFFGLPDGDRSQVSNDEYHYDITDNGRPVYHTPKPGSL
jgi:hypothetical protein